MAKKTKKPKTNRCYTKTEGPQDSGIIKYIPLDRIPMRAYPPKYSPKLGISVVRPKAAPPGLRGGGIPGERCCFTIQCGEAGGVYKLILHLTRSCVQVVRIRFERLNLGKCDRPGFKFCFRLGQLVCRSTARCRTCWPRTRPSWRSAGSTSSTRRGLCNKLDAVDPWLEIARFQPLKP
jgi:hypothetical protein